MQEEANYARVHSHHEVAKANNNNNKGKVLHTNIWRLTKAVYRVALPAALLLISASNSAKFFSSMESRGNLS